MTFNEFLDMQPPELLYHVARGYLWLTRPVADLHIRASHYVISYEAREGERHLRLVK